MREIRLLGELGKKFGRVHRFDVSSPAEAVRALCANFKEFENWVIRSSDRGVAYRVTVGKSVVGKPDDLRMPASARERITIAPVIGGAKSAFTQVLLGAVLIGASFFLPPVGLIGTTTLASLSFSVGVSLVLGGVAQMLAPTPKTNEVAERPENKPSYLFNGPVNTVAQGHPVPIGYGRMIVGSAVISAGMFAEDIPV